MRTQNDVPIVAIIGRTNVGKSSLFNALTSRQQAIVEDSPGVTRDRRYGLVPTEEGVFRAVDTGGFVGEDENPLQDSVRQQAEVAVAESDLVIVVFDGMQGPSPLDNEVVQFIRKHKKPALWVVNKCEKPVNEIAANEFFALGIDDIIPISAAHRVGISELKRRVKLALHEVGIERLPVAVDEGPDSENVIRVALIGRPNVGKSSLINKIVGEERVVASPMSGTTRDSVDIEIRRDGQRYVFVDTAGLRRKARVEDHTVERYGNLRSLRALAKCDVAILVLDASSDMGALQDTRLAGLAHERGRGLIIVVNKWDAVEKDNKTAIAYKEYIAEHFKFARYAPTLFVSALTGRRCPSIIEEVRKVYNASRIRVPTAQVNKVLKSAFEMKPPPIYRGVPLKLLFATQISELPPTFVLFLNHTDKIHFGYKRYLKNILRNEFGFAGVDIKMFFRKRRGKDDSPENYSSESYR
jgi:GTP-binding protein